ncbi:MAG: HAMP domain-containing sensor histidine kinase [Mariprofundales bacterium]|nr:HAMP domain-containing sensor histidine kinase [Mariprofundales bacterium]
MRAATHPMQQQLLVSSRRLLQSFAFFLAGCSGFIIYIIMLMIAESIIYAISGVSLSSWALVIAALVTAFYFSPIVRFLHTQIDHRLFPDKLDTLAAIRELGAGDLARLPQENIEQSLLDRIAAVCSRSPVALDEMGSNDTRKIFCQPKNAPKPDANGITRTPYEITISIPSPQGVSWLHLGRRNDGWPLDDEERAGLESLAKFATTSLEHARLSHLQAQEARLDSIARIAAQLQSHDLKNRIHDLDFLAHNLESGELDPGEVKTLIHAVRKVSGRMQTLMQRLTDPNAPIKLKLSPIDLQQRLTEEIDSRLWPEGVQVHHRLTTVPLIQGDWELLFSVFENLFDNAVQAMNKQGTINILLTHNSTVVTVSVQDDGIGMEQSYMQQQLFELFSSSKEQGLGVGLYLSRRIITLHKGEIHADSAGKGCGATFTVQLPIAH